MTLSYSRLTIEQLFEVYNVIMNEIRAASSDDERQRLLWDELEPLAEELKRRYPKSWPLTDPVVDVREN